MLHPASHDLLRSIFWPVPKGGPRSGVLKWERVFNGGPASDQAIKVSATAAVCKKHLVLKTLHTFADGQSKPGLEVRWDWVPGQRPALVHYSQEGEQQPLVESAALNQFKGQVYRANVAPYWER